MAKYTFQDIKAIQNCTPAELKNKAINELKNYQTGYYRRKLNKQYGRGCTFDENWDYVDDSGFYDNVHCYDWESMDLDEPLA